MLQPIIMAGGSGTRLWPLSRSLYPKQFLKLDGEYSLLQQTVLRLQKLNSLSPIFVCNEQHRFLIAEQLREINIKNPNIILEPVGRDTAPAITISALTAISKKKDPVLLVLAADHLIEDNEAFIDAVDHGTELALKNRMVTFGINPSCAETGFGYIRYGKTLTKLSYEVRQFIEKPNKAKAEEYLKSNEYFWNSGIFMFQASTYLNETELFCPDILSACKAALTNSRKDIDFLRIDKAAFQACPKKSIDYAVMEKTPRAVVVKFNSKWNDIGSWSAVWELSEKDEQGNALDGDALVYSTSNCYISARHKLVATIGLENVIVVDTPDAVLVAKKSHLQEVKNVVEELSSRCREETINHRKVYRPWGFYDLIGSGHRHQVKRISVKPGGKLSLQMHHHRAEHWVIVKGTAKVTNGNKTHLLSENQSIYIPIGEIHALENPGKIPLELIEVQSGAYLGEDDIIRLEDKYGRDTQKDEDKFDYESIIKPVLTETN
jgi:mannose-1-phosphate guanylyltransferase